MKIYKDKELATGKECRCCKSKSNIKYYKSYDLFLCKSCFKDEGLKELESVTDK